MENEKFEYDNFNLNIGMQLKRIFFLNKYYGNFFTYNILIIKCIDHQKVLIMTNFITLCVKS